MYCIHSPDSVFFIDEDGNTDFRCGDHINVYPFIVKALKQKVKHGSQRAETLFTFFILAYPLVSADVK